MDTHSADEDVAGDPRERWRRLPDPIRPEFGGRSAEAESAPYELPPVFFGG